MATIIITGASDGIGAAAARQLRARGHDVVVVGRSPAKTQAVARALGVPFHVADYARLADVRRLAKVIQTASAAANMWGRGFDIADLQNERGYRPQRAYGNGKLANILFTRELHRRHHADGISAVAFHPGVVRSNFASDTTHVMRLFYRAPLKYLVMISPERSGRRLTALAEGEPGVAWQPGEVCVKNRPMPVAFRDDDGRVARELWERSEAMLARAG